MKAIPIVEAEAAKYTGDQHTGIMIFEKALEALPGRLRKIPAADPGVVVEQMRSATGKYGFDAARGEYVDLMEAGIIDPTKVVRVALENAASVAGTLLLGGGDDDGGRGAETRQTRPTRRRVRRETH